MCTYLLVVGIVIPLAATSARASEAARVSGLYRVVRKTDVGPQTSVRLQFRLTNHRPGDLHIQRLTLWDFSHPRKGGTQACSIVVRSSASVNVTQEFTIPRSEYEIWKRGTHPRLVLEVQTPGGGTSSEVVRLDRITRGRGN